MVHVAITFAEVDFFRDGVYRLSWCGLTIPVGFPGDDGW
jgi:hypothetical protein